MSRNNGHPEPYHITREIFVWTLADRQHAGEPDAANSFADPRRITPVASTVHADGSRLKYDFPALSLVVLQWSVR